MQTPNFVETLQAHPEAVEDLNFMTIYRYTNGQWPKVVRWLMKHPQLLRALAQDAEQAQPVPNPLTQDYMDRIK